MRVRGAELIEIRLRLREAFTSAAGSRRDRRILLVRVAGDEGVDGWGECVAGEIPSYTYETTDTAWDVLSRHLLPSLPGREVMGPEEILTPGDWVKGHPMAKAALEMAIWDLEARCQGVPLWELLGGSGEPVSVGMVIGLQSDDDALYRAVDLHLSRGYARVKLKIEPGRDVEMVRGVRDRFPEAPLAVDANGAYSSGDEARIQELDDLGLLMLEQPFGRDDLVGHARLQALLETPICLDESIGSSGHVRAAFQLGACRVVNIKPGRVGGLASAREILGLCRAAGVSSWCGGMLESGVGRAHALAFATLPGLDRPADLSEPRGYWERDVVTPDLQLEAGQVHPSADPGIGVRPDVPLLRELTVRRETYGNPEPAAFPL